MKRSKTSLSKWTSRILVVSGLFQTMVITAHIKMITGLYSTIIGFYMFGFVLFTIVNILNGANFSAKKSLVTLIMTYLVSAVQCAFFALYAREVFQEIAAYADVVMNKLIATSLAYMGASVVLTILALVAATVYYFRKHEDISIYF